MTPNPGSEETKTWSFKCRYIQSGVGLLDPTDSGVGCSGFDIYGPDNLYLLMTRGNGNVAYGVLRDILGLRSDWCVSSAYLSLFLSCSPMFGQIITLWRTQRSEQVCPPSDANVRHPPRPNKYVSYTHTQGSGLRESAYQGEVGQTGLTMRQRFSRVPHTMICRTILLSARPRQVRT